MKRNVQNRIRKVGAAILTATLVVGSFPAIAQADPVIEGGTQVLTPDGLQTIVETQTADTDYSAAEFATLGLSTDDDVSSAGAAPFSTIKPTNLYTNSEIYTAANGAHGNTYIIRDVLDRLEGAGDRSTKLENDYGQTFGGGGLWNNINKFDNDDLKNKGEYGGGTASFLGSNSSKEVLANEGEGFHGLYAKSVAFSNSPGEKAQRNHIAELRAGGDDTTTTINGKTMKGSVTVEVMSVKANGERQPVVTLYPTVVEAQDDGKGRLSFVGCDYYQVMEGYFDIEAADINGDGMEEIFVYAGAYKDMNGKRKAIVNMFRNFAGKWKCYEIDIEAGNTSDYYSGTTVNGDTPMYASPVVTLAAGDIDRNGDNDIAITCSAPFGKKNVADGVCEIYTYDFDKGTMVESNLLEPIFLGNDSHAMVSANCTFGSFTAYDSDGVPTNRKVDGLIIAGYESLGSEYTYSKDNYFSNIGYRYAYYDLDEDAFVVSDYMSAPLGKDAKRIVESAAKDSSQDRRHACTLAPIALCTADLQGLNYENYQNDAVLVGGDIYPNFHCTLNTGTTNGLNGSNGSISLCSEHYNRSNRFDQKDTEHIWIGDVVSGCVSGSDRYNESFLAVVGIHRDEDLGKDDDYYWMDLSHYTINDRGMKRTGQEEVIAESNRKNTKYGTWISLCLPDIDKDGVIVKYNSQYKLYTNPAILAVLQEAPYEKDLQDVYDYLFSGATAMSKSESSGSSDGVSVDAELGWYVEAEGAFAVGAQTGWEIVGTASYDYEHGSSTTYSVEYEAHAGDGNKVVIFTIPIIRYCYDIYDQKTGTESQMVLDSSLGCQTSIVSAKTYDKVAKSKGLLTVGDFMTNTTGTPKSYVPEGTLTEPGSASYIDSLGKGRNPNIKRKYTSQGWQAVTSDFGAATTASIEHETEDTHNLAVGFSASGKMGGGVGFIGNEAFSGVTGGLSLCYTHSWISSKGVEFSGAVDNLPEDAGSDYGFSWRLAVDTYEGKDVNGNDQSFYIVGYDTKEVVEPKAPIVTGLRNTAATSDSVTMEWDEVLDLAGDYDYGIGMIPIGQSFPTSWVRVGKESNSYTWSGLNPNTTYQFKIAAIDAAGNRAGLASSMLTTHTYAEGVELTVAGIDAHNEELPLDNQSKATVNPGQALSLAAAGTITGRANDENVNYTWYKKEKNEEEWEIVKRETLATGSVSTLNLGELTEENNGDEYYFMVSDLDMYMNSGIIQIDVEKVNLEAAMKSMVSKKAIKLRHLNSEAGKVIQDRETEDPIIQVIEEEEEPSVTPDVPATPIKPCPPSPSPEVVKHHICKVIKMMYQNKPHHTYVHMLMQKAYNTWKFILSGITGK